MLRYLRSDAFPLGPALFVDRDGVLNHRVVGGYVLNEEQFILLHTAVPAMLKAQEFGVPIVVVTNQGMISRGMATERDLMRVHGKMIEMLNALGIVLDAIYTCPHHPLAPDSTLRICNCRKPLPGLLHAAVQDLGLDIRSSIAIGDSRTDVEAAIAAGIPADRAALVNEDTIPSDVDALTRWVESHLSGTLSGHD